MGVVAGEQVVLAIGVVLAALAVGVVVGRVVVVVVVDVAAVVTIVNGIVLVTINIMIVVSVEWLHCLVPNDPSARSNARYFRVMMWIHVSSDTWLSRPWQVAQLMLFCALALPGKGLPEAACQIHPRCWDSDITCVILQHLIP